MKMLFQNYVKFCENLDEVAKIWVRWKYQIFIMIERDFGNVSSMTAVILD